MADAKLKLNMSPVKAAVPNVVSSTPRGPLSIEQVRAQIETVKIQAKRNGAGTDQKLFSQLMEDVLICRKAGKLDVALSRSYDTVACVEMNRKSIGEEQREVHAIAICNLASTLHMLGHLNAAKQLYEQAHNELFSAPKPFLLCCIFSDVRKVQLDYIASRAVLATEGQIPDSRAYLDGDGEERIWDDDEVADAQMVAARIEQEIKENKPPPLNLGSLSGISHKSYPITSTPRKELW